jgi:hypothetical protein
MNQNLKYVLIAIVVLGILYLLYNNKLESLNQESKNEEKNVSKSKDSTKLGVYYTNWCGYSQRFNKDLDNGLEKDISDLNVSVERIDCDKNKNLCKSLDIPGYPTLLLHKENETVQYEGDRSRTDLLNFIENHLKH